MIRFRMFRINLAQFATLVKELPTGELGFNVELSYKYANEGRIIACSTKFDFASKSEKVLVIEVVCEFEIAGDDWTTFSQGDTIVIPKDLLEFFAVHTIGTTRGIMYCKTENTSFNKIIIPPLNVAEMVQENMTIKKEG